MISDHGPLAFADPFERQLVTGLAVEPSAAIVERMDRRVRAAIQAPVPLRRPGLRLGRGRWTLLLVAATIAMMGAGAGALGLFTFIVGSEPGWSIAWERADRPALSTTSGGIKLTLERTYADANQVVVFLTTKDPAGTANLFADRISLTDADGRTYAGQMGVGDQEMGFVAHEVAFATPEPWLAGERSFTLSVASLSDPRTGREVTVTGPWTIRFSLASQGGRVGVPGAPVTLADAMVELRSLVVSPTMIRGELAVTDAPTLGSSFAPIGVVRIDSRNIDIRFSFRLEEGDQRAVVRFGTVEGIDGPAGHGEVSITELVGFGDGLDGTQVRLAGPWVLPFELP